MALEFVDPGPVPETWNFCLYGPGGSGKSVGAASAPGPILYLNADTRNSLFFARAKFGNGKFREVAYESANTLTEVYLFLSQATECQTVVVDPVGDVHKKLLAEFEGSFKDGRQLYQHVNTKLERFCRSLCELPDINVVLVCHEQEWDDEGSVILRPLTGGKSIPEAVVGMVDIVSYCAAVPQEDGDPKFMGQVLAARGRRAKDRSGGLGASRELDLTDWCETATAAMAAMVNDEEKAAA